MADHASGGDDRLNAMGDYNVLLGDASAMSGDARGGNDRLSAAGFLSGLSGDTYSMSEDARGGNDWLNATGDFNVLSGDAYTMSDNARGGNDRLKIRGRGQPPAPCTAPVARRQPFDLLAAVDAGSIRSDFVLQEADEGNHRQALIPVLRQPIRPPLGFREIHAADLSAWQPGATSEEFASFMVDLA